MKSKFFRTSKWVDLETLYNKWLTEQGDSIEIVSTTLSAGLYDQGLRTAVDGWCFIVTYKSAEGYENMEVYEPEIKG